MKTTITFAEIREVLDDLEIAADLTKSEIIDLVYKADSIGELRRMIESANSITKDELIAALFGEPDESGDGSVLSAMMSLESSKPTGAWGKGNGGISASHLNVDVNMQKGVPDGYWENVRAAVSGKTIPPALLVAIFCRESNHGRALNKDGFGDNGHAYGVGQVDVRYHDQYTLGGPYSIIHMRQAAAQGAHHGAAKRCSHPGQC